MNWPTPAAAGLSIATVGHVPPDGAQAITAVGGRVSYTLDWNALDTLATGASDQLVVAVVPRAIGHGPLERLATILDESGLRAVIAFPADALDAVAAVLMGPGVTLLCDPGPGDWATAVVLAAIRAHAVPAGVREGGSDAERLRRLHEEIARITAMLAGLAEDRSSDLDTVEERQQSFGSEPPAELEIDPADVRRVIRARRLRGQFFDPRLLEDPGWDMLLDLFAAELEHAQVSVSSLCIAAGVASTTALRWISRMADAGLLVRVADPSDGRRAFLVLSARASGAMRRYVAAARRSGLPLV